MWYNFQCRTLRINKKNDIMKRAIKKNTNKHENNAVIFLTLSLFLMFLSQTIYGQSVVKMWEDTMTIKTYLRTPPDLNARFYEGIQHQGVQRHVYPYAMDDGLSDNSEMKTYKTVCLENDYIKISVVPELGGRVFSAYDKVAKRDFIYKQDAIKPALVGMSGAWITGAIAWGFPHHHGPLTIAPFDYYTKENPDGSKTVFVSKLDIRHRMRELISITLHPDNNVLSVTGTLSNPTPYENTFLFFTNPAVKPDPSFQIYFDPSVEWATYHKKTEMVKWPIADSVWQGIDYTGVDISLWRNIKSPTSFFSLDPQGDFFGGYSHQDQAGIVYVGNHHITPGMKVWEYGPNPQGDAWIKMVTDNAGHNIEMMVGAFSDNEPDYSYIQPYEVKQFENNWFPISKLGGLKYADLNGAINLEVENSQAKIRVNSTSKQENAKILLEGKGNALFDKTITISPDQPFLNDFSVPNGIKETDLKLSLYSSSGKLLLSYQSVEKANTPKPKTYHLPGDPKDFKSVEELYFAGKRLVQFYNAECDPQPYFDEALRRDPDNYNVNTLLGLLYLKRKMWKEAEEKLEKAVNRITYNYTRPKTCEATYYLAIAQKNLGKLKEAYDNFYRATWDNEWNTPAYDQLGQMDMQKGNFANALVDFDHAISTNTLINRLHVNCAIALRKLGKIEEAEKSIKSVIEKDLLDFFSINELYLLKKQMKSDDAEDVLINLKNIMRDDVQSYLELTTYYDNLGLYDEAIDVLMRISDTKANQGSQYPMVYYYLGYLWNKKGDQTKSSEYLKIAATKPWEYCFPWREEEIVVLEYAKKANPSDAKASYYLGCLQYENDPAKAMKEWELSASIDDKFSYTFRNLAWGYNRDQKNVAKAIGNLEKAVSLNNKDARFLYELDLLYEMSNTPIEKRLNVLESNISTLKKRDDALLRLAIVYIQADKYDKAINLFSTHHFNFWEGIAEVQSTYQDACILRGIQNLKVKKYDKALKDFKLSYAYPSNLDMGIPPHMSRFAELYYYTGLALEGLKNKTEANKYFQKAANEIVDNSDYLYYQGLSFRKLNNEKAAQISFEKLSKYANREKSTYGKDQLRQFGFTLSDQEWLSNKSYTQGLSYLVKGMKNEAKKSFQKAIMINPHIWASFMLKEEF